jgi:hypothetical protein
MVMEDVFTIEKKTRPTEYLGELQMEKYQKAWSFYILVAILREIPSFRERIYSS